MIQLGKFEKFLVEEFFDDYRSASVEADAVPGALIRAGAERHVSDFSAGFYYLRSLDFVDGERIAMNGYCFGGGITWQAATEIPRLKATAAFYGPAPTWLESLRSNRQSLGSMPNSTNASPAQCRHFGMRSGPPTSATNSLSIPASTTRSTTTPASGTTRRRRQPPGKTCWRGLASTSELTPCCGRMFA